MKNRWLSALLILSLTLTGCTTSGGTGGNQEQTEETPAVEEQIPSAGEMNSDVAESLKRRQIGQFYFDQLQNEEQTVYVEILDILLHFQKDIPLSCLETDTIERIFQYVLNDHPEIFYVEGYTFTRYTLGSEVKKITFSGTYTMDEEERKSRQELIRSYADNCLNGLTADMDDYEKARYIYEYIINSTEYDADAPDNQNICSVFLYGRSVCQGYAKATQYLLNHLGVMCTLVQGTVDTGEAHAWNLVRVDGSYYYVDTTWGDASYRMEDGSAQGNLPEINYDYLCVTTQDLLRTHRIDSMIPLPECTATQANYYVREGIYFTSYDREQMREIFDRAAADGRTDVTLKCADEICYEEICHALIDEQEIFSYMQMQGNGGTVTYAQNGKQLSLTFWVTND